jgi:chloramphenicol 3-O-phosphotransferase
MKRKRLFLIGGASGTGKTTVCRRLAGTIANLVVLDGDVVWSCGNFTPDKAAGFYSFCLRLCAEIADSGVDVAVFHAGMGIPENILSCGEKSLFSTIHFLALTCADDELERRLMQRPEWKDRDASGFIRAMKGMNAMYRSHPGAEGIPIEKVDTTDVSPEESSRRIAEWIAKAP